MKKTLAAAPPGLSRILLTTSRYQVNVQRVHGNKNPMRDCLSRHALPDTFPEIIERLHSNVHMVYQQIPVTDRRL
ncbi:hypothetical protein DPMN_026889 [Dreissena polymorpha]|uniref:Uncharacterized protein n=1 Tax=Dreissena polymorpha TaxID=45954 RepID=A0A9D4LU98_DREPO|nr:hypothetical protein DPMN_026889 [Dreissena polymorpha]